MAQTWFCTDLASVDVTDGDDFNESLEETEPANFTNAGTVEGGVTDQPLITYTTLANVPGLTSWPSGDYHCRVNITTIGTDVSYKIALVRVDSGGNLVSTLGTSGSLTATGLNTFTHNLASPLAVNAGDRLQIRILATRTASHGNQALDNDGGTGGGNSARLDTPITLGGVRRVMVVS